MAIMTIEELYERYVKPLPAKDRLRLVSITTDELSRETNGAAARPARSVLDYEGVGKDNPIGMDAQAYVSALRSEWDGRP